MDNQVSDLDPFLPVLGLTENSDDLQRVAELAGLQFEPRLTETEAYSNKTRLRALKPRILEAYRQLDYGGRLTVASAALAAATDCINIDSVDKVLARIGWKRRDDGLVVETPDTREVFFPKGSQWDAHVVLNGLLKGASEKITVIDPYCDSTLFHMLGTRFEGPFFVQILCSKYAEQVSHAGKKFTGQHGNVTVNVRKASDFHDRFIVIDGDTCYHVGASIKDAGNTAFMVNAIEDPQNREALLLQLCKSWEAATPVC